MHRHIEQRACGKQHTDKVLCIGLQATLHSVSSQAMILEVWGVY